MCGTQCGTMLGVAIRLQARVTRRSSLPLTEQDDLALARIRTSETYQAALRALGAPADVDVPASALSEAALLHAVFEAGLASIRLGAQEAGYALLADQRAASAPERRAESRRRAPSWSDEA
jgi:hypothetical protein